MEAQRYCAELDLAEPPVELAIRDTPGRSLNSATFGAMTAPAFAPASAVRHGSLVLSPYSPRPPARLIPEAAVFSPADGRGGHSSGVARSQRAHTQEFKLVRVPSSPSPPLSMRQFTNGTHPSAGAPTA